ncbi:hypothetical protein EYW49_20585 [Siculibacillus lacustris]|uniref:Uncharacterized protein n=1 Tax=Siculibacillus lacustris TaxID=1549641 RepID=A0A4Q9VEV0_9HYPH|nr:hypothetical protein [Siculibacillus lacustris]TBW33359.1 hypothetical protein EYW49_20585 [Siculibacillus lacustris]
MTTLFARFDAIADRAQSVVFGDDFEHHPMTLPVNDRNARRIIDPSRPVATFRGILVTRPTSPNIPDNYDPRSDRRPGVSAPADQIEIPAAAGLTLEEGDILVRLGDAARWQVANTAPDDTGRVKATVNRLK